MRVVFLQKTTDAQGGSKASLRNTLRALSRVPGMELELCGEAPGPLSDFAEGLSIPFHSAPYPRWRNFADRLCFKGTMGRLAQTLGTPDWIVSNEMWWAPHAVMLAGFCHSRSAVIVRDEIADLHKAKQYQFSKLDRVVTVSKDLKEQFASDMQLYDKTETIYNIIERPLIDTDAVNSIRGLCGSAPLVNRWLLSAGTICPRKDQILTVRAMADLVKRGHSDLGLLIVGGDDGSGYRLELTEVIGALGMSGRAVFAGQIDGIGAALAQASVLVLSSHSEGLPRVLIEGGLSRVPSVSTRVSGVDEVYGEFVSQFVSDSRSASDLADKIEFLLSEPSQTTVETLAENMEQRFCSRAHIKAWKRVLQIS